jgi:2-methylcitrate dehydratase PrpD
MIGISFARQLARHVTADNKLTTEITDWMKLLLLDYYAVTTGGVDRDSAVAVRSAVSTAASPDSFFSASVHGTTLWATPDDAALINGVTAHGLELDDTFEESSLHPAVVIFPAVLALADERGYSAANVLKAAAVGYDVMCTSGVLLGAAESYGRGFHPTGVAGVLGAAAAVSSLFGLDEDQTTHALSLAANLAAGSLEFLSDGSWTKRLNAGHAATGGLRAGKLAAAGFTAPETSIEGRDGFLNQYGQGLIESRSLNLVFGKSALDTSIKFYPCCRYMHGNIDLLRDIHSDYPNLDIDEVESIEVGVIKAGATLISEPTARKLVVNTPVDAQFNMPFGAAVALTTGQATVAQFDDAPAVAVELQPWLEKVHCYTSERLEAAFPASWQAEVSVRFKDGRIIERSEAAFRGAPQDRATRDQLVTKAASLLTPSAAQTLDESVQEIEMNAPLTGQVSVPQKDPF